MPQSQHKRSIRSFVLRQGRMTPGQQRAFEDHWPRLGLGWPLRETDMAKCFGPGDAMVLEIGCGNGEVIVDLARRHPQCNFLGIEVHGPGIGQILLQAARHKLDNIRLIQHDAQEAVEELADDSFHQVLILFADPWPKKRHHKRRLIQTAFVDQVARILKPGGMLYLATDWLDYRDHILEVMEAHPAFENRYGPGGYMPRPVSHRPETKYERRALRLGHHIWDLAYSHSSISK